MSAANESKTVRGLYPRFAIEIHVRRTLPGDQQVRDFQVRLPKAGTEIEAPPGPLHAGLIDQSSADECLAGHDGLVQRGVVPRCSRGWRGASAAAQEAIHGRVQHVVTYREDVAGCERVIDFSKKAIVIISPQRVSDFRRQTIETLDLIYGAKVVQNHSGELVGFRPPLSFVVTEEEGPVLFERGAESCSVLVLPQRRIGPCQQGLRV